MARDNSNDDQTKSFANLMAESTVLQYRIINRIGAGGMGEVFLAEDTELNRRVALKFLPAHLSADPECRARFKREAQSAAALKHPNIVTIYQVAEVKGRPLIAMEYVEGESLKGIIGSDKLSLEKITDICLQIGQALAKAHSAGIIHRDIKPSNIVIDQDGRPKLLDFGLATMEGSEDITKTGSTMGTIAYMSPEQIRGDQIDARSDLYSLGTILYELITGRRPFEAESEAALTQAIAHTTAQPLARYCTGVPSEWQRVVSKLLEKQPDLRYQTAADLVSDLKSVQRDTGTSAAGSTTIPSIAVLPFSNLSADPEQEYFCDGMAEEMISSLSSLDGVRVASRTSSFAFRGKSEDIRDIGHRLGVGHVLEGSVRKAGSRLRIVAQLVSVTDGCHIWSEKYDREMEDLFAIQDEISLSIIDGLRVKLTGEDRKRVVKRYTDNIEAYNLHLKSRHFLGRLTKEDQMRGIQCLQEAIKNDPDFALAYVDLAMVHTSRAFWGAITPHEAFGMANDAIEKAIKIDDLVPDAHSVLAVIKTFYDWEWGEGEKEFRKALELQPDNALTHVNYGLILSFQGRDREATEQAQIAQQLDPISLMVNCWAASIYAHGGDLDRAVDELSRLVAMDSSYWHSHFKLSYVLMRRGELDEAVQEAEKAMGLADRSSISLMNTACLYNLNGETEKGRELADELTERAKSSYVPPTFFLWIDESLGDLSSSQMWLDRAYEVRDGWLLFASILTYVDKQSEDVAVMLKKIGLK